MNTFESVQHFQLCSLLLRVEGTLGIWTSIRNLLTLTAFVMIILLNCRPTYARNQKWGKIG